MMPNFLLVFLVRKALVRPFDVAWRQNFFFLLVLLDWKRFPCPSSLFFFSLVVSILRCCYMLRPFMSPLSFFFRKYSCSKRGLHQLKGRIYQFFPKPRSVCFLRGGATPRGHSFAVMLPVFFFLEERYGLVSRASSLLRSFRSSGRLCFPPLSNRMDK